jgi:hypothetical protein
MLVSRVQRGYAGDAPKAAFINVTSGRQKRLYYGIFETDSDNFRLVPAGRGYVLKEL